MPFRWLLRKQALNVFFALTILASAAAPFAQTALARENPDPYYDPHRVPTDVGGVSTTPQPAVDAGPGASSDRYADLRQAIQSVLADVNGTWGIGVQDLSSGDTLLINADRPYEAASQYKLMLLYEAYRHIEAGTLDLDQMTTMVEDDYVDSLKWDEELKVGDRVSVKGLLRVMVIQSSNAAAHALGRVAGIGPAVTTGAAQELGLSATLMATDGAMTSVPDLMRFYGMLYRGELVSKASSASMMDLLKQQQINDRIPALLPDGVKVAHKTGNLPGVVNDAGIIFGPRRDVILVVLNDGADYEPGTAALAKISQLVYNWHNR